MNKVGKQKPKPPPYPRPVPHLIIEELPPTDEDIAWSAGEGGGYYSDKNEDGRDEIESEGRAAKRRRIEACAQSYLRGESLHIMSARLKGPFQTGWKNPWAKKFKRTQHNPVGLSRHLEIPETAKKIPSSVEGEDILPPSVATPRHRPTSRSSLRGQPTDKPVALTHAPSPFTSRIQNLPTEPSPKVPLQAKEKRVQEWLRTNDGFPKSEILVHSSPTPVSRQLRGSRRSPPGIEVSKASQSEPPESRALDGRAAERTADTAASSHVEISERLTRPEIRVQQLSREMQNMIAEPLAQPSADLQDEVRKLAIPASSSKSLNDASRAEFAIMKARNRALQIAPADAHMSPFEFKRAIGDGTEQARPTTATTNVGSLENITKNGNMETKVVDSGHEVIRSNSSGEMTNNVTKQNDEFFATAPQPEATNENVSNHIKADARDTTKANNIVHEILPIANSTAQPMLITAASDMSTTDMLPSAQPRPDQPQSMSSVMRDDKLLSIKQLPDVSDKVEFLSHVGQDASSAGQNLPVSKFGHSDQVDLQENQRERANDKAGTSTPVPVFDAAELNTQEMLANIEPLNLSTVKKPKASTTKDSPITATNPTSDKKRKKASFARNPSSMSSHNSIRDSMRARVSKNLASPPMFLLGKDNLDIEVSDEEDNVLHKRPKFHDSPTKTKGILKSTNPSSSSNTQRKAKGGFLAGLEPDRPVESILPLASGQNAVEEDKFDLDAAIDDLGSFLGTWDADREASSLDIGL